MKKRKILTRGIATALAVVSVFFVSHYAKAGENYIKTGEKVDFTELYDSKEFSTDNSKVTLSKDNKTDGLFVDGKTEEIENARFMLSKEIDFSDKSGYLVFSGTSERKRDVTLSLYLDDSTKSFAKVKLTRQNRKNAWIFMQESVDIYAERAYSMHCQGGNTSAANSIYTPHSGSYRAISKNRKEK